LSPGFIPSIFAGVVCDFIRTFNETSGRKKILADLGVFATLEERRNANKSNIIIPHHSIFLVITRYFKHILKNYNQLSQQG